MNTDQSYRQLPRYANSDLGELARNGKPFSVKPETLAFGTAFHTLILEPEHYEETLPKAELEILWRMEQAVLGERRLCRLLDASLHEQVRTWIDPVTSLPLKAKIDCIVMPKARHLVDLKTTSCATREAFIDRLITYHYDRQAAFYLSSDADARYFEIVGVQKQAPYLVFYCPFYRESDFVQGGRRKMNYLLGLAKIEADKVGGWRPSAWLRNRTEG